MVLGKHEIEKQLHDEHKAISEGELKEDNPLDSSEGFRELCEACRKGDLKACQEKLQEGVNVNARDRFDYTPLILASLCGHYEVVLFLIESGALCERDTFQGERCLYNALNDRIRNLLLSYDYSKSRDPLQPFAAHITSLMNRKVPNTSDIKVSTDTFTFELHKFVLAARSPYFAKKLDLSPDTASWKVPSSVPLRSLEIVMIGLYFGELNLDFGDSEYDQAILAGIDKLGRTLDIANILSAVLETDRRLARQKRTDEVDRGQGQIKAWFEKNVLGNPMRVDSGRVDDVKWLRQNSLFADVLLCAEDDEDEAGLTSSQRNDVRKTEGPLNGIPVGPSSQASTAAPAKPRQATLFPVHRAMLIRSDYFDAMFSSPFKEAQETEYLPIIRVDCNPDVLRIVLYFLYTEETNFGLDLAIDVLFIADQLMLEKLKIKAATIISTLGNGSTSIVEADNPRGKTEDSDGMDIFEVIRAGWDTRVHRLEDFGARYMAYRLERFIDTQEFMEIVKESAARIKARQETDTVELIDDIRYYLGDRFRMRFEDTAFDQLEGELNEDAAAPYPEDAGVVRTLDGEEVSDEFAQDAMNYRILLGKIDTVLERLSLDA